MPKRVLAHAGRILDRRAAGGQPGRVPGVDLLGAVEREADRAAVGVGGGLAVDRLGDHEHRTPAAVAQPALVVGPAPACRTGAS